MRRREFTRRALGALGGMVAVPPGVLDGRTASFVVPGGGRRTAPVKLASPGEIVPTRVDGDRLNRHLEELGRIGRAPGGGIQRVAYSEADLEARELVRELMRQASLSPSTDLAGNLLGWRAGTEPRLTPLMFGSHIDSVPSGGNFDGPVGTLAAIEVARTLAEKGIRTRHPLEVVVFQNEEGGKTGSRAIVGKVGAEEMSLVTASGYTIGAGIRRLGGDPGRLQEVIRKPGDVAAFLELHVEQGAILDREGVDIGVVLGIVGIKRWTVAVTGFANHAGTTPMNQRKDALLAAARFIDAVNRVAVTTSGSHVATVGRIEARPGAPNVIPGEVVLSLEIRDLDPARIDALFEEMEAVARGIGESTGTRFELAPFYESEAAPTEERVRQAIESAAEVLGVSHRRMPSGAGHDAQSLAQIAPVGMMFIPSVGGVSHSPDEFSRPEDIEVGANLMLLTLLELDREMDPAWP